MNRGPTAAEIAAANAAQPASRFLDADRVYRIRGDNGRIDRNLLDSAWAKLQGWTSSEMHAATAQRQADEDAALLAKLEALYAANGWDVPQLKERKSNAREQRREVLRAIAVAHRETYKQARTPNLAQWLGEIVRKGPYAR